MRVKFSIRTQLTFLYFSVLGLSGIAFFWIFDIGFQKSIETTVNDASRANLETIRRLLLASKPETPVFRDQLKSLSSIWASGALFEVADANGEWLFRSEPFLHQAPPIPRASTTEPAFFTVNLEELQYRVAVAQVVLGQETFEIQTAVPTEPFDQALDRFRLFEEETLPLLVVLASVLGYWLGGKSLAPVRRIIGMAEQIGVENLSRRLGVPEPRDELRRLTEALNAMLARIGTSFRRVTQFTADASHDLLAPMTVIRTTAEIASCVPRLDILHSREYSRHGGQGKVIVFDLETQKRGDAASDSCARGRSEWPE